MAIDHTQHEVIFLRAYGWVEPDHASGVTIFCECKTCGVTLTRDLSLDEYEWFRDEMLKLKEGKEGT